MPEQELLLRPVSPQHYKRRRTTRRLDLYALGEENKPKFTFLLRPRFIQESLGCKLICTVSGTPRPSVSTELLISSVFNILFIYFLFLFFICLMERRKLP